MTGLLFFILAIVQSPHPFSLLLAAAVHEGGHLTAALLLGWSFPKVSFKTLGLRLYFSGAFTTFSEVTVCLAGSLAGLLFALSPFAGENFRLYSFGYSAVSLLPISCLDGGSALLSILERITLPHKAYFIQRTVSATAVLIFWIFSLFIVIKTGEGLTLIILSLYITITSLSKKQ